MEQYNTTAWLGETIPIEVHWDTDIEATATLLIFTETQEVFQKTAPFINNTADVTITPLENAGIGIGKYSWLVKITHFSGAVDILPDSGDDCDCDSGECPKPTLEICGIVS